MSILQYAEESLAAPFADVTPVSIQWQSAYKQHLGLVILGVGVHVCAAQHAQ